MITANDTPAQAGSTNSDKPKKTSCRDILLVHPACAAFPDMSHAELIELGNDIKQNGLAHPVVVRRVDTRDPRAMIYEPLDGKNRLSAMEAAGVEFKLGYTEPNSQKPYRSIYLLVESDTQYESRQNDIQIEYCLDDDEVAAYVRSLNEHRRHLTTEQKRDAVAKLIKANPTKSNRQIAEEAKVSHPHVAKVRGELEKAGDVETVSTSIDTRGRKQPAKKAKPSSGEAATVARFKAAVKRHEEAERDRAECIALNNKCIEAEKALADHKATQGQKIITADERKAQYAADENRADNEAKTVIGTIAPFLSQFSDDVQALDLSGITPDVKQSLIQILTTMGDLGYRLAQHVDGRCEDIAA